MQDIQSVVGSAGPRIKKAESGIRLTSESPVPIDFRPPWIGVTKKERQQLEAELAQEVCLLHPLAALDREVVARRIDTDDILIAINPHLCECAQVHLTWSGKTEMNPEVPSMELQATFQDWVQERMLPDHKAFTDKAAG